MRSILPIFISAILLFSASCGGAGKPQTPFETFVAYTKAIKEKDTATMKSLLSQETIKMHEQEAKVQNVALDEIVKRQTLFTENQRQVKYRNEKIEGEKATLEVENSFGTWETVPFVLENGTWKIDKKGFVNQIQQDIEQRQKDVFDQGRVP